MVRPMTSIVSTVSGCVANSHQTLHHVSCSPSKIPYGGFSPVRLQTGTRGRPSSSTKHCLGHASADALQVGPYTPTPLRCPKRECRQRRTRRQSFRIGANAQSALDSSHTAIQSRGPWLASGFYCPARSSLTTASSATLALRRRFMDYSAPPASTRVSPIYSACPSLPCRLPYPDRSSGFDLLYPADSGLRRFRSDSTPVSPRTSVPTWSCNEAAKFASCYGPAWVASPSPTRTFPFELSSSKSPSHDVEYGYAGTQSIPAVGLSPTGQAALWAANELHESHEQIHPFVLKSFGLGLPDPCDMKTHHASELRMGRRQSRGERAETWRLVRRRHDGLCGYFIAVDP
jgi:hypothetical protein